VVKAGEKGDKKAEEQSETSTGRKEVSMTDPTGAKFDDAIAGNDKSNDDGDGEKEGRVVTPLILHPADHRQEEKPEDHGCSVQGADVSLEGMFRGHGGG